MSVRADDPVVLRWQAKPEDDDFARQFAEEHPNPRLPTDDVSMALGTFQARGAYYVTGQLHEFHLGTLGQVLRASSADLDPILVWRCGDRWYVVDGHHRLEAYRRAAAAGDLGRETIPVQVIRGGLEAAVRKASEENAKARLQMSQTQKMDRAWWLVSRFDDGNARKRAAGACKDDVRKGMSLSEIAAATGVTQQSVTNMRRKKVEMIENREDPKEVLTWARARRWVPSGDAGGPGPDEEEIERMLNEKVEKLAGTLHKHVGTQLYNNPELAQRTLARFFGRDWQRIVEEAAGELGVAFGARAGDGRGLERDLEGAPEDDNSDFA